MRLNGSTTVTHTSLAASAAAAKRWLARADVRAALVATLVLRLGTILFAALMPVLQPGLYPWRDPLQPDHFSLAHYPSGLPHPTYGALDYLTQPWNRWDTIWYLDIAQRGYVLYGSSAFLPLYPSLVRCLTPAFGGSALLASLVVSTIAAFGALLALYRLTERLAPRAGAGGYAVLVAASMPLAFFLMSGYTEALFLALAIWAVLAALDGAWWRFAALGALAALTRQQGLLLALMPVWSGLADVLRRPAGAPLVDRLRRVGAARAAAACAPPAAYALWLVVLHVAWHAPMPWAPLGAVRGWGLRFTWPGSDILADFAVFVRPGGAPLGVALAAGLDLTAIGVGLVLLTVAARRFPPALVLYLAVSLLTSLMKVEPSGLTTSEARYTLALLPLAVLPGAWLARGGPARRLAWVGVCMPAQVLLLMAFVLNVWVP
jgi:hypothetical protein